MKIINDPTLPLEVPTAATIGNFDGVHIGHKEIIQHTIETARKKALGSCVITFYPHPQTVLRNIDVPLLFPIRERYKLLEREEIEHLVRFTFTKEIASMSARDFISRILVDTLNIKHLTIGPDFAFGKNREGDFNLLKTVGKELGFETEVVGPARVDGEVVSSSSIRKLIKDGDMRKAVLFLGKNYYVGGNVVEGEKRGRIIGFPTANLDTDWDLLPKQGVYATYANIGDKKHKSITNIGYRPTFQKNELLIETHIFEFSDDIYNQSINVEFVERIRDEKRFESADALVVQITKDVQCVKEILSTDGG